MSVCNSDPFIRCDRSTHFHLIIDLSVFSLYARSRIDFVCQNTRHGAGIPDGITADIVTAVIMKTAGSFVFHRGEDFKLIKPIRNSICAVALQFHVKYSFDDFCGVLIDDELVLICRIFFISVACKASNKLSIPALHIELTAYFDRYITAIRIIDQILKGNDDLIDIALFVHTVIIVIDRKETNLKHGKDPFQIFSRFDVISPEA